MNSFNQLRKIQIHFGIIFAAIGLVVVGCDSKYFRQQKWLKIERQQMLERVQAVGGWDVLRKDCILLAKQCGNEPGNWYDDNTNGLPASIIALKPRRVEFYPPNFDKTTGDNWFNDSDFPVVRITIFNEFYTGPGGSDKPPLGLDILCGNSSGAYNPHRRQSTTPSKFWNYQKMTNDVYGFYGFW